MKRRTIKRAAGVVAAAIVVTAAILIFAPKKEPLLVVAPTYFRAVARDLSEMTAEADYIVAGTYEGLQFEGDFSAVFLGDGEAAREKEGYVAGHVYDFLVQRVLKGDVPEMRIPVLHNYSERRKYTESDAAYNDDGTLTPETWRREYFVDLIDQCYVEPETGGTYILFLKYFERDGSGYYRGIEPFMVRLRDDDTAELQSNLFVQGAKPDDVLILDQTFRVDGREILVWDRVSAYPDLVTGLDAQEVLRQIEAAAAAPGT